MVFCSGLLSLRPRLQDQGAPDLKVVLSPLTVGDARNENALQGGVVVSPLLSNRGAQEFRIPPETDPSLYRSVLIHCEQYSKLWGGTATR